MSNLEISVPLKIQNIVCSMQLDTRCSLLFSTNEFLQNDLPLRRAETDSALNLYR